MSLRINLFLFKNDHGTVIFLHVSLFRSPGDDSMQDERSLFVSAMSLSTPKSVVLQEGGLRCLLDKGMGKKSFGTTF